MMDLAILQSEAIAGMYRKPIEALVRTVHYDLLPASCTQSSSRARAGDFCRSGCGADVTSAEYVLGVFLEPGWGECLVLVADCYIHVEHRHLQREEFDDLSRRLLGEATELAQIVRRGKSLDFTFEEGTLFQRLLLVGTLAMTTLDVISHYHDLRESVIDMVHDGEKFSNIAIERFHKLTHTDPSKDIYKRTSSRDMNRLRRIVHSFDEVSKGNVHRSQLPAVRSEVIHDLAGLARANPNDPEIANIFHLLPKDNIPDLPSSPREAIIIDEREFDHKPASPQEYELEAPSRRPRRRFHKTVALKRH